MKSSVELFREMLYDSTPREIVVDLYQAAMRENESAEECAALASAIMALRTREERN